MPQARSLQAKGVYGYEQVFYRRFSSMKSQCSGLFYMLVGTVLHPVLKRGTKYDIKTPLLTRRFVFNKNWLL
jgi:hypothetical protein